MTTLNFPQDPIIGDLYEFASYTYKWDGEKWKTIGTGSNPTNELRKEVFPKLDITNTYAVEALRRSYAEAGLNLVEGSFEEGGELLVASDVVITASGAGYSWSGAFPKVVVAGSTPTPLGSGGWIDRSDLTLRGELAGVDGASHVGGATYAQIRAYTGNGKAIKCVGRDHAFDGAHGNFVLDELDSTSADNDGTILIDALSRRWKRQFSGKVNVIWFGADPNGITDSLPAFNKAVANVSALGGDVYAPWGLYKLTGKFSLTSGVGLVGDGCFKGTDSNREGVTVLFCEHTEAAMLSLKGANGCYVRNISLQGSSVLKPKTGLSLGRSSSASAGHHHIENVTVIGYFTVAGIYIAASEENTFTNVVNWNFGGNADYGLVVSTQDVFGLDGMVTSTCLCNNFYNLRIYNTSPSASAAGVLLWCSQPMGSINFFGLYIAQYAGAYVKIHQGAIDGVSSLGPFNFHGLAGEIFSGGAPKVGIDMVSSVPLKWNGITISNPRFQLPANAAGDIFDIRQDTNTTLVCPSISMPPPEAYPYATSQVRREKIIGGSVSVGRVAEWTPLALNAGWISSFGAPYSQPAYRVGNDGIVELRGVVQSASGGAITTLPYSSGGGDAIFPTIGSGAVARVKLEKSTGVLSLLSGTASTGLDLSGIRFSIY